MIKMLFFIPELSGGGAERVLCNLVNNMDKEKFDITVQTISDADAEKYLAPEIQYKSINKCKSKIGKKIFHLWVRLFAELKILYPLYIKDNYDIEVAYLECGATKIMATSTNEKALKLAWVHCDLTKKDGFMQSIRRFKEFYQKYDKVVCVSETVRQSYKRLFGDTPESVVLYNVNDEKEIIERSQEFSIVSNNKLKIVSVGRLSNEKGFDRLIEACHLLKNRAYEFEVLILGEGTERENLESLIEKYQLEENIKMIGFVDNPYPYLFSADIIVCSSRFEGFSTVITEAVILGKSIVTTPCAGMDEILGESEYGIITEDTVEGIYKGIKEFLDSEEKREYYSSMAKRRGKEFSKEILVKRIEDFFVEELKEKVG